MVLNINEPNDPLQGPSEKMETFVVFQFQHGLGQSIKRRIKSHGCSWNGGQRGWLCSSVKQNVVKKVLGEAGLTYAMQTVSLPKGVIAPDPKIANLQAKLEILEEKCTKDSNKLVEDVYRYDAALRPEDFAGPPSKENKSTGQVHMELDFHQRLQELKNLQEEIEKLRQRLFNPSPETADRIFDPRAPLMIAESLLQAHFLHETHQILQYCAGTFWKWNRIKYVELSEQGLRQLIYAFLRDAKAVSREGELQSFNPTKHRVDEIIDALRSICHRDGSPASGAFWLDERQGPNPADLICFRNGLLNIKEGVENPELIALTPLLFNVNSLDFDYDPKAPEAKEWFKFLGSNWPEDKECQQFLQEAFGYYLTQDTRHHKILFIVGPTRSGKGTIGRVLRELLGHFNVVGPTLSSLGKEFGLQPLLNKMLAIIPDVRLDSKGSHTTIIERLLSISGEDFVTIDRKFLSSITTKLSTRIVMMSNELPGLRDASGAIVKRYLVLPMKVSWLGREDPTLFDRLRLEMPGILLWALEGLKCLQKRGKFVQPTAGLSILEELETIASPVKAFINERCEICPSAVISVDSLFAAWEKWCCENHYQYPGDKQSFGKKMRAAFPQLEDTRPQANRDRTRCYIGIRLKPLWNPSADVRGRSEKKNNQNGRGYATESDT